MVKAQTHQCGHYPTPTVRAHQPLKNQKIVHEVFNETGKLSAVIKVYGAWLDLTKRKLIAPPKEAKDLFLNAVKTDDFEEIVLKNKA